MIPLLGRTQYRRGAVVFTLKHTFLSDGFHNLRFVVTTSVKGPLNLRSEAGSRTRICSCFAMAPRRMPSETAQSRGAPAAAAVRGGGDWGGGRVAARPEQRSSSRTGPRLTTAAQAACLLLGSG